MSDYNDGLVPDPCLRLDYGFGQQYASVELGDGTGYVRVTDDLRSEYHKMKRWYDDELRAALDENAKLLELCVQMVETVECSSSTKRCALFSECEAGEFEPCLYEQKLRNLGIEVPE